MARKPKKAVINAEIDKMIKDLQLSFDKLSPADKINAIKVAITWEKTKHSIKEGNEGEFFGNESDDDDEE